METLHDASSTSTRSSCGRHGGWPNAPPSRSSRWPARTRPCRSSAPAAPGRPVRRRLRRHAVGEPPRRRRTRPGRPRTRRRPARSGTRCSRAATPTWPALAQAAAAGAVRFRLPRGADADARPQPAPRAPSRAGIDRIDRRRARARPDARARSATRRSPWIYLIVATGDIYEDIPQAQAAAREGADVIAVIRSTGQSLLDYVPEGATREGYAGTYATQENFRLMRAALDDVVPGARPLRAADELRLRPVHARDRHARRPRAPRHDAQRLHVRDPLPRHQPASAPSSTSGSPARSTPAPASSSTPARTTTSPPPTRSTPRTPSPSASCSTSASRTEAGPAPTGSSASATPSRSTRDLPDSFRLELAHAQLVRELFPDAPLKWMPPTKHMTGDVFRGYLLDGVLQPRRGR